LTPHRTLRSSPLPRSPLIDNQSGSRAVPPFASSLITLNSIQRVSRPDSVPAPLFGDAFPFGGARLREAAYSAAFTIGGDASGTLVACPSVAGRPRRGPRASDVSSKTSVASAPGTFARSSAPLPSAAFATGLFGARHFVVASLARVTREASLSAGESVDPLSPEPRLEPRLSPTLRVGARISRRASCNRIFNPRATTAFVRNPSKMAAPFGGRAVASFARGRAARASRPIRHLSARAEKNDKPSLPRRIERRTAFVARRARKKRSSLRLSRRARRGASVTRSAAKPCACPLLQAAFVHEAPSLGAFLSTG